ncbi:hypothetical protein [Mesorhizobium sp. ES1-1]|uniref:hypothetical protein n=1 Tax=Mesorhizobium sp. ES1-1 TaxID=2876629 RepID=UPI001CCAE118|nr:hypothetical protein [Mesorhizobium sp. ES1-1]MBZ9677810.1 hypothetical protein [Mesorhizobium sp. ES1-1]
MTDYTYLYRDNTTLNDLASAKWDVFISAHNPTERVLRVFDAVSAKQKDWVSHAEYGLTKDRVPPGSFTSDARREDDFMFEYFEERLRGVDLKTVSICVDVTGFMRPHMLYLVHYLSEKGAKKVDIVYAEPGHYKRLDDTQFASDRVHTVRQVAGYEGITANKTRDDLLIINAGFEDRLTAEVAEDKDKARKVVLLGLPSLKADMYQQGVLRTRRARDALGEGARELFAPAADPFATATVLSDLVGKERLSSGIDNLYLSPLSTKPSALGFALFYIRECRGTAASIIFPFSESYAADASEGIGRIWKYEMEF